MLLSMPAAKTEISGRGGGGMLTRKKSGAMATVRSKQWAGESGWTGVGAGAGAEAMLMVSAMRMHDCDCVHQ